MAHPDPPGLRRPTVEDTCDELAAQYALLQSRYDESNQKHSAATDQHNRKVHVAWMERKRKIENAGDDISKVLDAEDAYRRACAELAAEYHQKDAEMVAQLEDLKSRMKFIQDEGHQFLAYPADRPYEPTDRRDSAQYLHWPTENHDLSDNSDHEDSHSS